MLDGAFPRHTDVLVVVTVLDSNEHSPMFLASNYSGSVVENSNVGNVILAVEAEDLDKVMKNFSMAIPWAQAPLSIAVNRKAE